MTASRVSSGGVWKTPRPRAGRVDAVVEGQGGHVRHGVTSFLDGGRAEGSSVVFCVGGYFSAPVPPLDGGWAGSTGGSGRPPPSTVGHRWAIQPGTVSTRQDWRDIGSAIECEGRTGSASSRPAAGLAPVEGVDRHDMHDFLASPRRARITPEQVGLPTYGEKATGAGAAAGGGRLTCRRELRLLRAARAGEPVGGFRFGAEGPWLGLCGWMRRSGGTCSTSPRRRRSRPHGRVRPGDGESGPAGRAEHPGRNDRHPGDVPERPNGHSGGQRPVPRS